MKQQICFKPEETASETFEFLKTAFGDKCQIFVSDSADSKMTANHLKVTPVPADLQLKKLTKILHKFMI